MKTIFTTLVLVVLMTSCKKNVYKCVCTKSNGLFGPTTKSEYQIIDTERRAKKQCQGSSYQSSKSSSGTSSSSCYLQ